MVEDARVGWYAFGYSLTPVEVDGVVAEQHSVEPVKAVDEDGQSKD